MTKTGTDISLAQQFLRNGELVAIPTETVYGLAANGLSTDAVLKIYEAKNRPAFNPLILHVADIEKAKELVESFPENAMKLAKVFWPGPLTLVLKKKQVVPDLVSAGLDSVGIRVPNHPLTQELLRSLDFPLAAPSANLSGYVSPTTPQHVKQQLGDKVAYILDGGACTVGIESTIVKVTGEEVIVLRLGGIELEKIEALLGTSGRLRQHMKSTDASGRLRSKGILAPGMTDAHYAPDKKIILGNIAENLLIYSDKKIGILAFSQSYQSDGASGRLRQQGCWQVVEYILSPTGNLHDAARNLFSYLRKLDESDAEIILAEPAPDEGLGRAINDRLRRASH
ncbi:MAG: L-threonylcarbamoyladenylate synthase [Chitinophagales bacterium]|nr:L-threonylcarbamoyladenylate synthase [Chitinophagales bacterium]